MKDETRIAIRIPQMELELWKKYCQQVSRTTTDVLREFIQGLSREG